MRIMPANCSNCTSDFAHERPYFTFAGAMHLRELLAARLNALTSEITGRPPRDPIDPAVHPLTHTAAQLRAHMRLPTPHRWTPHRTTPPFGMVVWVGVIIDPAS